MEVNLAFKNPFDSFKANIILLYYDVFAMPRNAFVQLNQAL